MDAYFPRGLRTEIVPGAGHFLHQERPDAVNRAILDFPGELNGVRLWVTAAMRSGT